MQCDKTASATRKEFSLGEGVFVKLNPLKKNKPWIYGEVVKNPASRACLVSTPLGPICQNHSQIRKARIEPMHHHSAKPDDLETTSLPGIGDMPADKNQPADQAVEKAKPTYRPSTPMLESEPTQSGATLQRLSRNWHMPSSSKDYLMPIVHYLRKS